MKIRNLDEFAVMLWCSSGYDLSSELKRCALCRRWYRPSVKAVGFQETCSDICRKMRRRRKRDLRNYRVDERARQRACSRSMFRDEERHLWDHRNPSLPIAANTSSGWIRF